MTPETFTAKLETLTAQLTAQLETQRHAIRDTQHRLRALEGGAHRLEGAIAVLRDVLNGGPPPEGATTTPVAPKGPEL
jgi:hypothetical protein